MNDSLFPLADLRTVMEERRKQAALRQENSQLLLDALRMGGVLLIAAAVFFCFFGFRVVSGNGMYPALSDGDLVVTYSVRKYVKDDVIFYTVNGQEYLGRVIAKGGDRISTDGEGTIMVNGTPQTTDITFPTYVDESWIGTTQVPEDSLFVLGDYRTQTQDSRDFGFIPEKDVSKKVFALLRHIGI